MVIFGIFAGSSLNKDKCPFCGKEFQYTTSRHEKGRLISEAHEEQVLRINSFGELALATRKYEERREQGTWRQNMICPQHKYEITRIQTHRDEWGKGWDSDNQYEVTRWDYEYVRAGNLSERQVKLLKRCCKNASKDLFKTYKGMR